MAIIDTLSHRGPTRYAETWMPMEEVLQRVAARFPLAVIDRERADQHVIAEADQMVEVYGPTSHLVELHRKMVGQVAYVTIREEVRGPQFHFFLRQCPTSIDIDYDQEEDREVCRPILEALAAALPEYDLVSEDPADYDDSPPEEEDPVYDILIHRNGLPNAEGRLPTAKAPLPLEEILRRVAARFPLAVIDRERGDQIVRAGAEAYASFLGNPTDPSVEHRLALVGRVAHVTIRDAVDGPQCCFFVNPNLIDTGLRIDYESQQDRMACRPLLDALVAALADYYCLTQDLDDETEDLDAGT